MTMKNPRSPWISKGSGAYFLFRGIILALPHPFIEFFDRFTKEKSK